MVVDYLPIIHNLLKKTPAKCLFLFVSDIYTRLISNVKFENKKKHGGIANQTNQSVAKIESIQNLGSDVSEGIKGGDYSVMGNQQYAQLGGGDVEAGKKAFNGLVLGTLQNKISDFKNNASVK